MSRLRSGRAAFLVLLVTVISVACSSGTSDPVTQTPSAPSASVPTETPVGTAPTDPAVLPTAFTVADIALPNCNTGGGPTTGLPGTAPGPTPTPLPDDGSRDAALISRELAEYFTAASPVAGHMISWSNVFNLERPETLGPGKQAESLQVLGLRAAQACDAVAQIKHFSPEVAGYDSLLREAVRVRHAWVRAAIQQLECCENAFSSDTGNGNTETSAIVSSLAPEMVALLQRYGAAPSDTQRFSDEAIGIEMSVQAGWIVTADGLNPILYAPFDLNRSGLSGLGPDRWQRGAAVRVRRLRNPGDIDVGTASTRFSPLVTQQGSVASVEQTQVSGVAALRHVINSEIPNWSATVTVFVSGDFTFFVETGCPSDVPGACESVESAAASLKLLP